MDNLKIEPTKSSPEINFDTKTNVLKIYGESYPEDAASFYEPVFNWVEEYLKELEDPVIVEIKLDYLNTSSSKAIMSLLDMLDDAFQDKKDITMNWHYNPDDELTLECGEDFKEDLSLPFNLVEDKC